MLPNQVTFNNNNSNQNSINNQDGGSISRSGSTSSNGNLSPYYATSDHSWSSTGGASTGGHHVHSQSMSPSDALNLGINLEQYISKRNERERSRVRNVNYAFDNLKKSLPLDNERLNKRISKVEILRTAISYIKNLEDVLGYRQQQRQQQQQQQQTTAIKLEEQQGNNEVSNDYSKQLIKISTAQGDEQAISRGDQDSSQKLLQVSQISQTHATTGLSEISLTAISSTPLNSDNNGNNNQNIMQYNQSTTISPTSPTSSAPSPVSNDICCQPSLCQQGSRLQTEERQQQHHHHHHHHYELRFTEHPFAIQTTSYYDSRQEQSNTMVVQQQPNFNRQQSIQQGTQVIYDDQQQACMHRQHQYHQQQQQLLENEQINCNNCHDLLRNYDQKQYRS